MQCYGYANLLVLAEFLQTSKKENTICMRVSKLEKTKEMLRLRLMLRFLYAVNQMFYLLNDSNIINYL